MEASKMQQEIILLTGTSFSRREFANRSSTNSDSPKGTQNEELIRACWDGLLKEMLPELFDQSRCQKDFFLWKINEVGGFLELECGASPVKIEAYRSIDPLSYLGSRNYN